MSRVLDDEAFGRGRRRPKLPRWAAPAVLAGLLLAALLAYLLQAPSIGQRDVQHRIINVILPPPPPPPPPVKPPEPKPKPKPKVLEQPKPDETPPPPTPPPAQAPSEALTAREGNGPANFGLAAGNGGGLRIGGGDNGFAAYGHLVSEAVRQAVQNDPDLGRAHAQFDLRLQITFSPEGKVLAVRLESSTGSAQRDAALERLLTQLVLSRTPPAGLPPVRIELTAR